MTRRTTMSRGVTATAKQISYALALMSDAGYSTEWMRAEHKRLGATMRERSGRVADWLEGMTRSRIGALIDELKS